MQDRVVSPYKKTEDVFETLRPQRLSEYTGQEKVKESLAIAIEAAKARGDVLDHVLLYGPQVLAKQRLQALLPMKWKRPSRSQQDLPLSVPEILRRF